MSLEKIVSGFPSSQEGEKELNLPHWLVHSDQAFTLRLAKSLSNWKHKQILKKHSGSSNCFTWIFLLDFLLSVLVLLEYLLMGTGKQLYQSQDFNTCLTGGLTCTIYCVNKILHSFCHLPLLPNLKTVLASKVFFRKSLVLGICWVPTHVVDTGRERWQLWLFFFVQMCGTWRNVEGKLECLVVVDWPCCCC